MDYYFKTLHKHDARPDLTPPSPLQQELNKEKGIAPLRKHYAPLARYGPNGFRTRVSGVRGQRPGPLDDGTVKNNFLKI